MWELASLCSMLCLSWPSRTIKLELPSNSENYVWLFGYTLILICCIIIPSLSLLFLGFISPLSSFPWFTCVFIRLLPVCIFGRYFELFMECGRVSTPSLWSCSPLAFYCRPQTDDSQFESLAQAVCASSRFSALSVVSALGAPCPPRQLRSKWTTPFSKFLRLLPATQQNKRKS